MRRGTGLTSRNMSRCCEPAPSVTRAPFNADRLNMKGASVTAGCWALALALLAAAAAPAAAADSSGVILAGGAIASDTCLAQPIGFGSNSVYFQASVSLLTAAAVASGCLE